MAYVLWRIFFKKYSKIRLEIQRHPSILVTPIVRGNNGNRKSNEEAWIETKIDDKAPYPTGSVGCEECNNSNNSSASTSNAQLDDVEIGLRKSDSNKVEVRRNKSRVRSYLKKCKDRLTGGQHHQQDDIQCNECQNDTPDCNNTTSWYVEEVEPPDIQYATRIDSDGQQQQQISIQTEGNSMENEQICTCAIENSIEENSILLLDSGIEDLIDKYLADYYPLYFKYTRAVLVRQARDVLVCTYHGCLKTFEENFMIPFTEIVKKIRKKHETGEPYAWCKEWPLATATGDVVLHLGTIDESIVRPQDIYICIRPGENSDPQLCIVWRQSSTNFKDIQYQVIDCEKQSLSPLSLEMLTDELPQLLQNLLIGIERAIGRIPLNELSFPTASPIGERFIGSSSGGVGGGGGGSDLVNTSKCTEQTNCNSDNSFTNDSVCSGNGIGINNRNDNRVISSPKCALKRSDLITKNKIMNNKYLLRRISSKFETNSSCESASVDTKKTAVAATTTTTPPVPNLPLFCLGGSFPHIDSDEENTDERKSSNTDTQLPHDIVAPRSIIELNEKLLASGIYLPGTRDVNGRRIITIDAGNVTQAGLNCYEVATVLLYYSTISESKSSYVVLLMIEKLNELAAIEITCSSLQLLTGHFQCEEILAVCLDKNLLTHQKKDHSRPVIYMKINDISSKISPTCIPSKLQGLHNHDQFKWREFFITIEPFQTQCITTGHRLVSAMADIRTSDLQGLPSRRQLYAQHRALSRALMDTELHYLRKRGAATINRLQELAKNLNKSNTKFCADKELLIENEDVTNRLNKVIVLFNEVDKAAKRLEQLTEQRRERLRELTRQRALEDEMNEVTSWIQSDGDETLQRFTNVSLDCKDAIKDHEHEFEKYYFISMKHLAKGRDLHDAAIDLDALKINATNLKDTLQKFSERLESARERIEGAARLHHLFGLDMREEDVQQEMAKLAEKIGVPGLIEKYRNQKVNSITKITQASNAAITATTTTTIITMPPPMITTTMTTMTTMTTTSSEGGNYHMKSNDNNLLLVTSTPEKIISSNDGLCHCWREESAREFNSNCEKNEQMNEEDEEEHSKIADSGLGGCDRCEGNTKLSRVCSCQSFEDAGNLCDKSNNSDELEEDCFEGNSKQFLNIHSPIEPNTHLQCHASSLDLPAMEELSGLDPKIQKTLLLIMREMIGTERDYVRSLYYVIENYMDELLREDIPQSLRGQRNVIFGNIEKIFEFHQPHFLAELERYENNPLKVGAAFLENESKFYLYALYNKNKPKSDTLMSEYGSSFFKSKQFELNDKMDLASYLLKPVQRMGKYALLLQQLVKACSNVQGTAYQEISTDVEELQRAEEMVKFQLRHGNDLLAMDSLRDCDVNVKEQGRLLRQNEFLVWQGRGGKKSLRQVFLFEELVLFSKARRFPDHKNLDIYIYKNSIKTSDIGLTAHIGDSPTKFEIWFRKRKPEDTWTLQSMSEDIKNAWAEEISKLLWKQAKRNREIRLAEMSSMGIGNKPCLDIRPSHNQINDRSISFLQLGKTPKLRNSFAGSAHEGKQNRRPNSIISECSMSSGTSSSSLSTGTSGSSSGRNQSVGGGLEHINETTILNAPGSGKKHQRSTTLVSQLSMESGILSDISMTPDGDTQEPHWPVIRKSSSSSSSSNSNELPKTTTITTITTLTATGAAATATKQPTNSELNLADQDPYINDSVTVHL